MLRRFFYPFLVLAALSASVRAQEGALHFLKSQDVDLAKVLPGPPKPGSNAQRKDMAISLAWQRKRTPAMEALAQADSDQSVFRFGTVLGSSFTSERLPVAAHFFEEALEDARVIGEAAKLHWNRPRPFVASALIHPCVAQPPTNSYPSNHATVAMLYAEILARMLPEQRLRLLARARQYAEDRVICGVHYTTDIEAGKRAGAIEAFAMFHNGAFEKEFVAAKAEVRDVLATR